MKLSDLMDVDLLNQGCRDGFISVQVHPSGELKIYNYTALAQYKGWWNEATLNCRGLIVDADDNIVARPFSKFKNLAEHDPIDDLFLHPFLAFEKLDGSLGITYYGPNGWALATRGSFTSPQALEGTKMLQASGYVGTTYGETDLFEILYPENRIVVDYGGARELVYLSTIDIETGETSFNAPWPGRRAGVYDITHAPHEIVENHTIDGAEGYVLYFPHRNERVKVKFTEYVRLHRIVTGVSTRAIWEALKSGDSLDEFLDRVPDELFAWIKKIEAELRQKFFDLHVFATADFNNILHEIKMTADEARTDRKPFALLAQHCSSPGLLFKLLDGKPINDTIWKLIEPPFERPFDLNGEDI